MTNQMISIDRVAAGVLGFVKSELLSQMEGAQLWWGNAALVAVASHGSSLLAEYANQPVFKAMGLVGADGSIDVDAAIAALKETSGKHGALKISIPYFGTFKLNSDDFDKLHDYIKSVEE